MRIDEIINEGVNDPHIFKAIFMAGGPGAGKNYIENSVIKGHGLKSVDGDAIIEYHMKLKKYHPKSNDYWRKISKTASTQSELYLDGRLGVVMQGTGVSEYLEDEINRLKDLGYETMMIFVDTNLKIAMDRNKKRLRKVPSNIAKNIWTAARDSKEEFKKLFGSNFHIVNNNDGDEENNKIAIDELNKVVRQFINKPVSNARALQWIEDQNENR